MTEEETFELPATPLESPTRRSPYTHPIHVEEVVINPQPTGCIKSVVISQGQITTCCLGNQRIAAFYRGDGMRTLKIFDDDVSKVLANPEDHSSDASEEEQYVEHFSTERDILFEGERIEMRKLYIYGGCQVIVYGDAIKDKEEFNLHIEEGASVQFRDFDCSRVIVHSRGSNYVGVGSCLHDDEKHQFQIIPIRYGNYEGPTLVDTSNCLDNSFAVSISMTHAASAALQIRHILSRKLAFRCFYNHKTRSSKEEMIMRTKSREIQEQCEFERDAFNKIDPLPYVNPIKVPTSRRSHRIRERRARLSQAK